MTAYDQARAAAIMARMAELEAAEPCDFCKAAPNRPCRTRYTTRPTSTHHSARGAALWEAYRLGAEHAKMDG